MQRDGRPRALWRILLFVALFVLLVLLALLLVPALQTVPLTEEGRLSMGLILQSGLLGAAALAAGWIMLRFVDGEPFRVLGLGTGPRVPRELGAGLALGVGSVALTVLVLVAVGAYRYAGDEGGMAGWLAVSATSLAAVAIPAAAEEAMFRGYLFRTLVDGAGAGVAIAITSVLFTLAHGSNPNVTGLGLVNILLAGMLLAVAVLRTGSLWFASTLHLGWNWVMAGPLDLPVSGLASYDVPIYDLAGEGPDWITGGSFGPEGGLAGTAAAALALLLVVRMTRPGAPLAGHYGKRRPDHGEDR